MQKIDYETAKKVKELRKSGATYDKIQTEVGIARATISRILKMTDDEIEDLKKERKEKTIEEKGFATKAERVLLKEIRDLIANESLERIRDLMNYGLVIEALWEKKREEILKQALLKAKNEEIKNYIFRM